MMYFSFALQLGLLWFLITLFTRQTDSRQSFRESLIVLGLYLLGSIVLKVLAAVIAIPGWLVIVPQIGLLYLLLDKVCGNATGVTIRICAWFFGLSLLFGLCLRLIS